MGLKTAATICLISLFAATLVLLITRALDMQAAARLEPQLARIIEELEGLRRQGEMAAALTNRADTSRLIVYYFHGKARCPTCLAVESQTHDVVRSDFAAELNAGAVTWKVLNHEEPSGASLAKKFEVPSFAVVVAKLQGDEIAQWKRLDRAGVIVGDQPRFASYVRKEIKQMLHPAESQPPQACVGDKSDGKASVSGSADKPLTPPGDLPIPQ